jgi:hypothetical protein
MFRPSLIDEFLTAISPFLRTSPERSSTVRLRLTYLVYYVTGLEMVGLSGQSKFTLEVLDHMRGRLGAGHLLNPHDSLDAAIHRFAQGVQARGMHHRTVACAEAFAAISGEKDNTGLKLALIRVVERIVAEVSQAVEEIAVKPDVRELRSAVPPPVLTKDVEELKEEFRTSGREWYRHLENELRHPASQMMLATLPNGTSLWNHARLMGGLGIASLVCSLMLVLAGLWIWALCAVAAWYFVFARAQTEAVYEVAARLLVSNRYMRRSDRVPLIERE